MFGMCEKYKKKHICVQQQRVKAIVDIEFTSYDLAFFCSSWDCRCRDITSSDLVATQAVLVDLAFRDSEGLRDTSDQKIRDFIKSKSFKKENIITQDDMSLHEVLRQMRKFVDQAYTDRLHPTRVLMDMTGFPRFLSLGLIAYAVKSNLVKQVDVFYSEASYGSTDCEETIAFTEGKWAAIPIESLEGEFSPCKELFILVSTGFEGKKTYRAVGEKEPNRISILMPDPGYTKEITERAKKENLKLIEQYKVPEDQILRSSAGDLVATLHKLDHGLERFHEENVFYLCCGTKPHSLALALRGCLHEECAVMYNKPESYKFQKTEHRGDFWLYQVFNLAVFE